MNVIAKITSGSQLYGTSLPSSDVDFRGIYLPTKSDCYLNRIKDTIEDKNEEDTTYFSLQRFLDLACQGQSIAIEMLSSPESALKSHTFMWGALRSNRKMFYTKNMHSFLGYAKSQSGKYSSRIDRLTEVDTILKTLEKVSDDPDKAWAQPPSWPDSMKLATIWGLLPESTNAVKTINLRNTNTDNRVYMVCGRELQATVTVSHAWCVIRGIHDSYGERVKKAKNGNIDWKSLAHAYRVAYQALEIVETGDLQFPLSRAAWLKELRLGNIDFIKEGLDQRLDDLIIEVQEKMDKSTLPERADSKWCEKFILEAYDS